MAAVHPVKRPLRSALALAVAAAAIASAADAQTTQTLSDDDDVLWAGDDAWSTAPTDAPADKPADAAAAVPPPGQAQAPAQPQAAQPQAALSNERLPGDDFEVETTAPKYDDFKQGLAGQGEWVSSQEYGQVWRPTQVYAGWRPYSDGRWVWSRYGWTWVAEEPFGWATYHYGRWWYSPAYGWAWVPGRVWAPAWVTWRSGAGYSGWAPMGPRGVVYVEPTRWVFVETRYFVQPVRRYAMPVHQTYGVWSKVAPLPVKRPGPTAGPAVNVISTAIGKPIAAVQLKAAQSATAGTRPGTVGGGAVQIFKPRGVPFRRVAAAARAGHKWDFGKQAQPIAKPGQPTVPIQPTSPRWGSGQGQKTPPKWGQQGGTPKLGHMGGVPSPGVIERGKQRQQEQLQRRREELLKRQQQGGKPQATQPQWQKQHTTPRPTQPQWQKQHTTPRPAPQASPQRQRYQPQQPSQQRQRYQPQQQRTTRPYTPPAQRQYQPQKRSYTPPARTYSPPPRSSSAPSRTYSTSSKSSSSGQSSSKKK